MFDNLIDNLIADKWVELDASEKNEDEWKEYHVLRQHKRIDDNTLSIMLAGDDGDAITVQLKHIGSKKDPFKQIGVLELKLSEDQTEIVGIDLCGDVVLRK